MKEHTGFRDSALRVVAIIGLVAILVLGAWGIIQLVVGMPNFFSNVSSLPSINTPKESLIVAQPESLSSDKPFMLAWNHEGGSGNYGYAVSYSCVEGLAFAAPVPTGQMQIIPCDTPFNFTSATTSMQLIPVLRTGGAVTTVFSVAANRLSDGKRTSTDSTKEVTVSPAVAVAPPAPAPVAPPVATPAPVPVPPRKPVASYTPAPRASTLYGSADLTVRILSITPTGSRYNAQFFIENTGTNVAARGWGFRAQLPLTPVYTFVSQGQQALYPGDKIVYTMGFDLPAGYTNTCTNPYYCDLPPTTYGAKVFSIIVDPQNLISESNKNNNRAEASVPNY